MEYLPYSVHFGLWESIVCDGVWFFFFSSFFWGFVSYLLHGGRGLAGWLLLSLTFCSMLIVPGLGGGVGVIVHSRFRVIGGRLRLIDCLFES